jgi:hypothetical protein
MSRRLPKLSLVDGRPTRDTLHEYAWIAGKIRAHSSPRSKHWWHVTLAVSARGLTTAGIAIHRSKSHEDRAPGERKGRGDQVTDAVESLAFAHAGIYYRHCYSLCLRNRRGRHHREARRLRPRLPRPDRVLRAASRPPSSLRPSLTSRKQAPFAGAFGLAKTRG